MLPSLSTTGLSRSLITITRHLSVRHNKFQSTIELLLSDEDSGDEDAYSIMISDVTFCASRFAQIYKLFPGEIKRCCVEEFVLRALCLPR